MRSSGGGWCVIAIVLLILFVLGFIFNPGAM
jgi:hypothetical protein